MKPEQILKKLGLTREQIERYVVTVAAPLPKWRTKARAKYLAMGLTVHGKERKRTTKQTL